MFDIEINYLAVLVAAVIQMALGFVWYSPLLFGDIWLKLMGWDKKNVSEKKTNMSRTYGLVLLFTLLSAYVLAHFTGVLATTSTEAAQLAFWLWLGFIMPVMLGNVLWEGKSVKLFLIGALYQLVSLIAMSLVLANWVA